MPRPTRSQVHTDRPLTDFATAVIQKNPLHFVAEQVFPMVPVEKQSDLYKIYEPDNWHRIEAQVRPSGTESAGGGYNPKDGNYFCNEVSLHKDVSSNERDNADDPQRPDEDATEYVSNQILRRLEKDWAAKNFTTGIWTGSTTGGDITPGVLWSAPTSDPVKDVEDQRQAMLEKTGFEGNVLVIGAKVFAALKNHPDIKDRVKYTQVGVITVEMLARLFEVEKLLVAKAIQNTAAEKKPKVMSFINGPKHALLAYATATPGTRAVTAGATFVWTGAEGAGANGMIMERYPIRRLRTTRIEGTRNYDTRPVAVDLGVFFNNAVA